MKFISWNVNGLRACMQKVFMDFFNCLSSSFGNVKATVEYERQFQSAVGYCLTLLLAVYSFVDGTRFIHVEPSCK